MSDVNQHHDMSKAAKFTYEPLLNEVQVAKWIGVAQSTMARWRKDGIGPKFIVLGPKRFAYKPEEIRNWMAAREFSRGNNGDLFEAHLKDRNGAAA